MMTAGLKGEHNTVLAKIVSQKNWVNAVFKFPMETWPGRKFNYNSGLSHILSAVVTKKTKISAAKYAKMHLFQPLNIRNFYAAIMSNADMVIIFYYLRGLWNSNFFQNVYNINLFAIALALSFAIAITCAYFW